MIQKVLLLPLLSIALWASGSFLKPMEHGEMIYYETRGVSCASCHGRRAEGSIISHAPSASLVAPALIGLDERAIKQGIVRHRLAPRYYLTPGEIHNLSLFLQALQTD